MPKATPKVPTLGDVVDAWNKLIAKMPAYKYDDSYNIDLKLWKEKVSSFGVLLQRLVAELPQQAKTSLKIDLDFPPNLPNERYLEYANKLWVALEAVMGKEASG